RHLEAIETAHEGISILNDDGEFIYVNEVYADLYNYEPEELLGEHWSVTYPDEEMEFARSEIMGTIDERGYWHGETVGVRADGSTFPEDHVVSETPHGDLVCTVLDLSDRREREAELRWKTRAMDEAPVGISITDPSQDDNPLIYVNDRFEELTGYDASDIVGRNCRLLQGEGTETEPVAAMREAVDAEESVTVELRNYRADGAEFWNRVKIAPVTDENGELTHFVGFQEDVTERKERERELKKKNERLDEFASIVSHDLRNPLQIAAGRIDLAREECDSDHLDDAANAVERSQALIDDLLVLAREGEELGAVEPVALASLVEDCWRNVATGEATLRLDTDRTIRADRSRLQQLLENLIGNAVEHGGEDVHVTVGDLDDGFYVADDGPGIPDDVRDEVFEAGYSTRTESTGFGLAIVEGVVDAHGWDVGVTESEHDGARFEITGVESVPQESTPS
ncbi:MAG: PAS domain S-box protein, partial [Haloplanus sp.]